jgi:hypothetical protein
LFIALRQVPGKKKVPQKVVRFPKKRIHLPPSLLALFKIPSPKTNHFIYEDVVE